MLKRLLKLFQQNASQSRPEPFGSTNLDSKPVAFIGAASAPEAEADRLIEAGNLLEDKQAFAAAIEQYQRAMTLVPDYWRAHMNLGNCYRASGEDVLALGAYRHAYETNPTQSSVCYNLGLTLVRMGRAGDAIGFLQEAIRLKADFFDAMVVLSDAMESMDRLPEGLEWLDKALRFDPEHPGILRNKALLLEQMGRIEDAEEIVQQVLARDADDQMALSCMAQFARNQGEIGRSLDYLRRALAKNQSAKLLDEYLLTLAYSENQDFAWVLSEHRRIQQCYSANAPLIPTPGRGRDPRRIGFISPDFHAHSVAYFVEPLFSHLDRARFEVVAYSANSKRDRVTERLQTACDTWRDISGRDAHSAARLIAADEIDILIDLAGHTGGNRLDVLAFRPAPIIATWLGYLGTTGLDAVDFRIADVHTDPIGMTECHHSEKLVRLPHSQWCYQPQLETPPVNALPASEKRYLTFGSFNHVAKLSDRILNLWADLLLRVEGSRLLLAAVPGGRARQRIAMLFARKGVSESRLEFQARTDWNRYFETFHSVDIALDSFPYTGGTTTCDALYMGVPVLTFAGRHSVARSGVSLLTNLGLTDWIANTPEEFLAIGQRAASKLVGLSDLRNTLRERFVASPLADQVAFAKDFAQVLDSMWMENSTAA